MKSKQAQRLDNIKLVLDSYNMLPSEKLDRIHYIMLDYEVKG